MSARARERNTDTGSSATLTVVVALFVVRLPEVDHGASNTAIQPTHRGQPLQNLPVASTRCRHHPCRLIPEAALGPQPSAHWTSHNTPSSPPRGPATSPRAVAQLSPTGPSGPWPSGGSVAVLPPPQGLARVPRSKPPPPPVLHSLQQRHGPADPGVAELTVFGDWGSGEVGKGKGMEGEEGR
uniref:Uncharacterized protein n=1 Tax=Rhizochromulina marina TaxID=1034831 RepID=A0A7S2R9P5_9STRA|mmetsp:Transcript_12600/g.36496  ORF Transcript_12600/g.36496 Transcript_12600/m.36496 type:complete len:183 (+) Transcript_12600:412-960(+)